MPKRAFTKKSRSITFHEKWVQSDLVRYVNKERVLILLNRLPLEEYQHLRSVTFETCAGGYTLGYVRVNRINSIVICDQSARPSIYNYVGKRSGFEEFGALPNTKWPTIAVRRYLLYHTFLHELRHTQNLFPDKKRSRKSIPNEKFADEYADYWRGELYKDHFDHSDPVHNLPSKEELKRLQEYWPKAMYHLNLAVRHQNRKDAISQFQEYEACKKYMQLYLEGFPNYEKLGLDDDLIKMNDSIKSGLFSLMLPCKQPHKYANFQTLIFQKYAIIPKSNYVISYGWGGKCTLEIKGIPLVFNYSRLYNQYVFITIKRTKDHTLTGVKLLQELKHIFLKDC